MSQNNQADRSRWSRSWIVLGVFYGLFFCWYTSWRLSVGGAFGCPRDCFSSTGDVLINVAVLWRTLNNPDLLNLNIVTWNLVAV